MCVCRLNHVFFLGDHSRLSDVVFVVIPDLLGCQKTEQLPNHSTCRFYVIPDKAQFLKHFCSESCTLLIDYRHCRQRGASSFTTCWGRGGVQHSLRLCSRSAHLTRRLAFHKRSKITIRHQGTATSTRGILGPLHLGLLRLPACTQGIRIHPALCDTRTGVGLNVTPEISSVSGGFNCPGQRRRGERSLGISKRT